ncbi:Protein kinase domain [Arabidopsis thaliana x Arabidopsis arenosa]|uniref:non-specific serine/threonine protein kinase n=2 Tax=Arabidopsis TaxID=3701 RepID=A0A1P8ANH8_ARATH|nr:Protein kinase superfamily protein [Arabidopsis thaliana]ANM58204.1 Protein kinase superfamily protein [Arabidopsis thaliana]KAG7650802.1 Protein kinase domain [Arabidopsis thaliana x Arabidopsis arenosa]|eukprot:NP_001320658.1 Protein kinase superfamily protein [Arabidopsis thaliana]
MYYLPTSCMFLFFLFSSFHPLLSASSKQELGWCEAKFQCGNITAGFPFSGGNRPQICGHPSLELHCYNNMASIIISDHFYNVLHIDQTSNTLRLARAELEGSFCNATYTATTLPSKIFEISSTYKSLTVFYLCDPKVSYRSSYTCPGRGLVSVSQNSDYHNSCQDSFTINVPKSFVPEEKELDVTNLESALREGFEVKVKVDEKTCQKCTSSGGTCGFQNSTQICCKEASSLGCNKVHPLPDATELELHRRCNGTFSCGDQRELFYPFWTSGREDCGHPDFKLDDCSGRFAELSISSVKFRILASVYGSNIIRLGRSEYIGDLCPQDPINAPFSESVLPFAPNTELLTIFYNCSRDFPQQVTNFGDFACGDDSDDDRSYYVTRNLSFPPLSEINDLLYDFSQSCDRNVSIPASGSTLNILQSTPSNDNLKKALEYGFELELNQDCRTCIDSKGACGYSQTSSRFVCYSIEEPQTPTPPNPTRNKDTSLSIGAKAGIAVASVSGLAILLLAGLFLCIRRRRKTQDAQYTSKSLPITSYSSRDTSRNPTSTTISSSSNHSLLPSISNLANRSDYCGVQVFSYEELEEATENFSRELGDGGFGTVYYGVLKDGRAVAVKRLYERSLKRVEQFKNEIEILKSLKHPNLVILYGCTSRHSRELLLVYEYISNGTLAEHLHGNRAEARPLCWSTRLNIAIETASALSFLHIKGIIHRDIKTTNILLDDNYQVKVADFGLSRLFPMDQTHISTAPQGTPGYVDPEYYQCYQLNEKSDVYSFGVVLTELISSKEAVDITRHRHDINLANMAVSKIQNNALHELVDSSLGYDNDPEVRRKMMAVAELAFRCLQQERDVRPAMDEIVEILRGIKDDEKKRVLVKSPDVVDIECGGGDDVGLLRNSVPPPISPETDKWTSSSDTAASL